MDLNFPLISKNIQNSSRTNLISSIATTQQNANDYSKSLSLLDGNMNKESALNMLSAYDLKKNRDEILRQYYQSDEMSFDDYSAKLDICKLLHKQNPLFSVDYYYKNFDKFMEDALGFKASPSSYLEGLKNSFAAGSTNLMNGIKVTGLLMDGLLNGTDGIEFNQKKEKLMSEINSSRANYRHDLAMEKYDNIFGKMGLETAMQAPQIAVQALTAFLTGGVLGLGAKATRLTSSIPMYLSQIGGVAESALEMGFDMDTTLALSFAVGTANQALEYIGDSPVMNNFVSFVKKTNKKTASELAKTSWKTVFGTVGNDIVKAIGTEVPTELGQTATEMFGLNLALAYEQKYKKKFEDLIGFTKEDFAKSLKDTAWSTVLSTPLIAAGPSVLENLGSLYGGEWAKTRNAGQFTKFEEGVSILDTGSILTPEYKSKIVSASVLKENPVAPIKYATIGNVKIAIDASDAQISAIKSSKFVYGKEVDISIPTVRGEDSISTSSEIDMGISLESALKIVRDAHKVNLLDGYSLLDADKKITKNEANAKYIAVARTGVETPAVVTLGEGKNTAKFAQDVFGTTFGNYKSEANKTSASDQDLDVGDVFDSASEMQDDADEVDDADEQIDEEESAATNNSNEQKDSDSTAADTKEGNQPANASSSNNSTNTEATVTEQANQVQSSEAKQDVRKQELTDAVVLEKAESDAYDEIDSVAYSSSSSQDSDSQQTNTDTTSQDATADDVNAASAPIDNTVIATATELADATINQPNSTQAPADATSTNIDANTVSTQIDASIQPKPSIFTSTIYAKKEEREAYNELKKQIKTNISNLNASNKYKIALDVNDIELLSDASALTLKAFATAANSSIANVVSTNEGLLEITNYFANASMPNSGKDNDFVDILSFSKQMAKLFYNNVSENTKAYKDIESVYGAFNREDENINKNMAETFAKDFNKWVASRNYGKANNSVLDIFKKLYESLRSVWNFLTGYKITKEKKALFESFFTDQNSVDLTLAKTAKKLANKKTSDKTANAVIKNAQNNAKDVNGSNNAILSDPNSVAKAVGKSINKKEKQDKNAVTILSKGEAYQRKVDDYKKYVNKYNASTNYKDYEKALSTQDWVKSFYENLSENEKKTLPSPDDVFIETPLELKESNTINAKPITASVSVQNSSTPTQSSSSQSNSDSVSINTASSTESNTITKKDKADTKKPKTKASTPKTAASKTTEYKGYSLIPATEEAINKAKEVIDAYEKTREEKISIIEKLSENIDNYQVADSKKKFINSFKKNGQLSKALMIIPEKEITFLKQINKHIEKQKTSKKIKNKDTGEETVIRTQVKDIIDDEKLVNEYTKVYQNSVDFNKDPSYDNFVKFMNSLMEYGTYAKLIAENPDGYLDEFTSVQEENSGAEIGENSEITKKNKWSVKPSTLIGDYSVDNSLNTTFDDYKEESKKYLQERLNAILKRRGNDRLTKLDNLMFQDGYLFKDVVDLSDANWEAIYDTKRGRVNEKDGKYTFDRNSLSEEIYNASNGNIDRRSSRLAASFLCMLPKSTQDAFIRKNNGNLILSAREAGLDIEGKVRAGSLLNSCKIILTPESDITSVIHEAFHLMVTYDTESRDNIYNSIKEAVLSKGEDYEKLRSFVEKNIPIFTKRSFEMAMEDFELFSKDTLTTAEQIRLDDAIASLFEAWMRNEKKNTGLLGKIGQLFKAIANKFREIYRYATGVEFLPDSIDLAFNSLFNEKDSKIYHYNGIDIAVVKHWKGYENVFRAQQSLDALAKVSIEDAANMASRFIEDHMDGALNMHDKYIHWLKSMKYEASMDRLVEYLSSNNEINRFIGRYNSEELKLEIVKTLAEWFINIPTSPSAVAKNISGMAKKLQKNIDDGNFKLITSDEDVSKLSSKDKKRVESAKESYRILSDYLSDIYKNARSKVSNMISVAADYAVFVGYNNSEAKTAFDNFIGNISKGTAKVDLSPEELLSIVDGLVTKEGKLILEQRDNVAWNPLIDMLAIASSYDDKFTASMRNNINHADPDYIDLANKILKIEQGVYYDREEESRDQTRVALAELALNYSDEDWISIVTDKTIEGDGTSNLLSSLLEVISNLNKKADELLVKKNKSLKTVIELNDVYNNLFNFSTDEELRIKALKDALEKAKKENDKSLEESKEIRAAAKRLNSAFEKLVKVVEGDNGIILKDKDNIDSIVKEIMKAFSAKERQLQKAIDRNKAEADKYANSDAYRTAKEIIELRNSILHKITRLTQNNDARVSGPLQKFFNIISSKDKKKDIKPIPKTIFKDVPSYIKPALSSALKSLMDAGVIVQLKDYPKANEFIMKKGTLEDGTVIYDENTWVLVKSLEEFTGSQDDRDVLSGIAEAFDKVKEQSKKFVKTAEEASRKALEEKRKLITESILSTKEIGLTSDEVDTWFEEEYHNQSSDEKNMNRQKAMHIFKSEFLTVSEQIKRFNPALYAYMYGGLMGNGYNENNLNTIIDKEIKNKTERTIAFNEKVAELFGVKASNVKYRFDKLFSNTKYSLSAMSYEELETNIGTNLGDLRYRNISLRTNDIDPRLSALAMKKNNVEVALRKLKDSKARLDKKLSKLMPGTMEYNKIYTQLNLIDLKIERNENILHGDISKLKKIPSKYTIQELMGIYIYAQQEDGIRRLTGESTTSIPNNIGIENIIWVMNEMLNNKELEKYRELADYIVEEVGSRYSEMAEVYARAHNFKKTLSIVDMYFPLATPEETDSKMLSESPLSMDIAMFASYGSYGVSKGMTKERTNTKMALSLDVIDSYISAINRQEHYIAFKQKYDEMKNLFKDGTDITKAIRYVLKDKQGEAQRLINLLDKYVDNIASNSHDMDIIDRIMSWVRKNFVASKLAWNLASMIQQLPTYLLVARKIGIVNALRSLAYIVPSVNHEFSPILQRSTQILYKQRPETADYGGTKSVNKNALYEWFKSHANENATMFTYELFNKFVDSGLAAIEFIDKKVTNAMYYALYNHNFEEMLKNKEYKEIFDSDVTKYEDIVIQVTQQELLDMISSSNAKDNPLAYSSHNSLLKQLLLFTSQTTKQFNMLWGSIADIKDIRDTDAIIGAFETFLTVGAVSMLSVLITGYPLPDDDGEDWNDFWAKLGIGTLFELGGTVPLIGSSIRDLAYGNNYAETNFIVEIGNLYKQLTDDEKGDCSIAFANTAAEISGFVGFPSTTAMKIFRAVDAASEDASFSDAFYLLNTRFGKGMNIIGE